MASKGYPTWTRDELVLALHLYMRFRPKLPPSSSHPEVAEVSRIIGRLSLVPIEDRGDKFRNPVGVYRKLSNFQFIDPKAGGGSPRFGRRDQVVWDEFVDSPGKLQIEADRIRAVAAGGATASAVLLDSELEEFSEGGARYILHRVRERDRAAIKRVKAAARNKHGRLACEACGFDFTERYGDRGKDFIECHHTVPISEMLPGQVTKPSDLALVCANCHRMLHRTSPPITVAHLTSLIGESLRPLYAHGTD